MMRNTANVRPRTAIRTITPSWRARRVSRYTSRMRIWLAFVLAGLVACGGPTKDPEGPTGGGGGGGGTKPLGPGDVAFEIPPIEVKGLVFEPEALGRPGMPLVAAKRK